MLEMGPQEDYIETVVTCEGDYDDPQLHRRLEKFRRSLKDLLLMDMQKLILKKVEPWNSVRVTFNIPKEAALRLKQLAQQGDSSLRELGVLAVQIQGDQVVSLTIAGRNNERTELILRTTETTRPGQPLFDSGLHSSDELNSPGPSNVEVTRKNIADYLRQGTSLFDTIINQSQAGPGNGVFKSPNVVATSSEPIQFRPNNVMTTSPCNTPLATSPTPMFLGNYPPGRSPTGYPASPSATYSTSPGPSKSPVHQPSLKYPSPPIIPPGQSVGAGSLNHVGLPPPPPYPGGATVNNISRGGKAVSVSSPLLVNLLQTEPLAAGFNSKMLPPQEGGPPPKRKRRTRKQKEASKPSTVTSEGEVPIQSVLNPVLDAATVLTGDRTESPMDTVETAHQAAELNVSLNPNQRLTPPSLMPVLEDSSSSQFKRNSPSDGDTYLNYGSAESGTLTNQPENLEYDFMSHSRIPNVLGNTSFHEQHDPFPPEITAGKIINPYTGQLEPVDKSPVKGGRFGGVPAPKNKAQRVKSKPSRENVHDLFLDRGKQHVNKKSATVTSEDAYANTNMAGHVDASSDVVMRGSDGGSVSARTAEGEQCPPLVRNTECSAEVAKESVLASSTATSSSSTPPPPPPAMSANVPQQIYAETSQSSQCAPTPTAVHVSTTSSISLSSTSVPSPTRSQTTSVTMLAGMVNSVEAEAAKLQAAKSSPPLFHGASRGHPVLDVAGKPQTRSPEPSASRPAELHNSDTKSLYSSDSGMQTPSSAAAAAATTAADVSVDSAKASAKVDPVSLLNSPSTRTTEANCLSASPPENKMPSEGDENSNHSGIINDITADNTTSAGSYLDSGSSKVYNHDSGVGSSSERSDDTPSEPGDNEFRGHPAETEEPSKTQKLLECKPEAKQVTVAFVMEQDHAAQQTKDKIDVPHLPFTKEKVTSLGHLKNHSDMYGQHPGDLHPNNQVTVLQWSSKDAKPFADHKHLSDPELLVNCRTGKLKNGPVVLDRSLHKDLGTSSPPPKAMAMSDLGHTPGLTLADVDHNPGLTMSDIGHNAGRRAYRKGLSSSDGDLLHPSSPRSQPSPDLGGENLPLGSDSLKNSQSHKNSLSPGGVPDRMSNYQCNTSSPEWLGLPGLASQPQSIVCDIDAAVVDPHELSPSFNPGGRLEPHSPSGMGLFLANNDGRCLVDMDSVQSAAKGMIPRGMMAHSPDNVIGSNITSKYSKRSSPVNVNMLNHMYAPGLPLPRRLTESIQRLVKPLGDPSLPQMRACKAAGGGSGAKYGPNGDKSPRASHGGRSPGSNVPRSSASGGGVPTSQAALVSTSGMPQNMPSLQQNTVGGAAVSMNHSVQMVSGSPQTYTSSDGHSGSHLSTSVHPPSSSSLSDRNPNCSSLQHSISHATHSSLSLDNPFSDVVGGEASALQACAASGTGPSQHPDPTDSAPSSNQQLGDTAEQLVPSSSSHKCNTHSGPSSQANPPYANSTSAPADESDSTTCVANQAHLQFDLNDSCSADSHNRTSAGGGGDAGGRMVNCVQPRAPAEAPSAATLSAEESQKNGAVSHVERQLPSHHSTEKNAGSDVGHIPDSDSRAHRQQVCQLQESDSVHADSSEVPNSSSVEVPDAKAEKSNSGEGAAHVDRAEVPSAVDNDKVVSTSDKLQESASAKDAERTKTPDLCSSEAAKISVIPTQSIEDMPKNDKSASSKKEREPEISAQRLNDPLPLRKDGNDEPKHLKKVAELLKTAASDSLKPKAEAPMSADNKATKPAQESAFGAAIKGHGNSSQPPQLHPHPEPDTVQTRRITRKRKSTHSESDGNSKDGTDMVKPDVPSTTAAKSASTEAGTSKPESTASAPRTRETRRHHSEEKQKPHHEEPNDSAVVATDNAIAQEHKDKSEAVPHESRDKAVLEEKVLPREKHQHHQNQNQQQQQQHMKDATADKRLDGHGAREEDQTVRRGNTTRRNKSLPVTPGVPPGPAAPPPPGDKSQYSFFNISIMQGRTRSQSAPTGEKTEKTEKTEKEEKKDKEKEKEESPNSQKRSMRSSRQKDHTDQPAAKRRRSRDHR